LNPVTFDRQTYRIDARPAFLYSGEFHYFRVPMREHERMLRTLLERLGLTPRVQCDNPNVWTSLRTSGSRSALFLMNLLSAPQTAAVRCRPAWSKEVIDAGRHEMAGMTVKVVEMGGK
jgi:hypothetical protein